MIAVKLAVHVVAVRLQRVVRSVFVVDVRADAHHNCAAQRNQRKVYILASQYVLHAID